MVSSFSNFWLLANLEYRICTRLARTKFILALTLLASAGGVVVVTLSHMQLSGIAPMFGVISPRYLTSILGGSFLSLFGLGMLFLAFDMQPRDENSRIFEVIATKPISNIHFFLGRLFGIFILMGIPLVSVLVLAVLYGYVSEFFTIPFGEPIEPWSVVSLLVLDVLPNFIFFGFLVLFLASFVRPRFVALLLSMFCFLGLLWINGRLPLNLSIPLQTVTGNVIFPSDLIPTFCTTEILLNRVALILGGVGFLYWTSELYPRNTSSGKVQQLWGVFALASGMLLIVLMYGAQFLEHRQISGWKQVHDEHFDPTLVPDVHHVEGNIDIYPGWSVHLDLKMLVSVSGETFGEFLLFSFNPGYRIHRLSIDGETITDYQFRRGLLKIPIAYFVRDVAVLHLKAKGRPREQFAYLDSVDRLSKIFGPEVRQLRYLGTENYIFRRNFVVLMPGIKWYPVAGTATNEDIGEQRPQDFFTIDLNVSVPRKWIVAGPAKREMVPDEKHTTYRFRTTNPVPQLALVASRFERASQNIEGIEFEVLYSSVHRRTFESLIPMGNIVIDTIQESLDHMKPLGLAYPYTVSSLVEVPASLRVYGGGSKLDTVLGMPGVLMMPESTLPTLHIDSLRDTIDFRTREFSNWMDDRWMNMLILPLRQYFGTELYAGNHLSHFYRSVISDQASATGPNAEMLNMILKQVVQLIDIGYESSFDFDLAFDREVFDLTRLELFQVANIGKSYDSYRSKRVFGLMESQARKLTSEETLNAVESIALADNDSYREFDTIEHRAFRLRGMAVSKVLIDLLGPETLMSIVEKLFRRYRAQNFSYADFVAEARAQNIDIENLIDDMLHSSSLPGFLVSDLTHRRIETEGEEDSLFQTTFLLENAERVSGYCILKPINDIGRLWDTDARFTTSRVLFVEKNQILEIVIESIPPIIDIVIEPYLSLNRSELRINVTSAQDIVKDPNFNSGKTWGGAQVVSIREVEIDTSNKETFIVVDDLDHGFSIEGSFRRWNFQPMTRIARRLAGKTVIEQIRGLPAFQFEGSVVPSDTWERKTDTTAYGKYWKTLAINRDGRGETVAKFATSLPSSGLWRLDYHVPEGNLNRIQSFQGESIITRMGVQKGIANIDVRVDSKVTTQSIDMSVVKPGWRTLGEYDIENLDVEVWVSNNTRWSVVFADAIRWTPVDSHSSTSLEAALNPK